MNRIDELFIRKKESILSVYFTAGYPELADTALVISGLEKAGADLIEIGFPFSDPVADGPVIQASSHQALINGMNLDILFDQLRELRKTSSIPKIMMGYYNTVYQYQMERFIDQCVECGIDGVIIPDLPPEIYEREYRTLFEKSGIHFICLVAPKTSPDRTKYLVSLSRGFIYLLSSSSTTGNNSAAGKEDLSAVAHLKGQNTLIGFGIHDHETFEMACRQANGAIIGTAFIRHLNEGFGVLRSAEKSKIGRASTIETLCREFVGRIRG